MWKKLPKLKELTPRALPGLALITELGAVQVPLPLSKRESRR